MILAETGKPFEITLNSKQKHFGVENFVVKTIDLSSGETTKKNVTVSEVVENIDDPAEGTVTETALRGTKTIKVDDDSTIEDGMVIKDENNHMYYVESVNGNEVKTRVPLEEDIAYNSKITQVGNTGIYKVPAQMDNKGLYNLVISNPSVDLRNLSAFVEVNDFSFDSIANKVDVRADEIIERINEVEQTIKQSDDNDYEVVG